MSDTKSYLFKSDRRGVWLLQNGKTKNKNSMHFPHVGLKISKPSSWYFDDHYIRSNQYNVMGITKFKEPISKINTYAEIAAFPMDKDVKKFDKFAVNYLNTILTSVSESYGSSKIIKPKTKKFKGKTWHYGMVNGVSKSRTSQEGVPIKFKENKLEMWYWITEHNSQVYTFNSTINLSDKEVKKAEERKDYAQNDKRY